MNGYHILMADIIGSRKKNSNLVMEGFRDLVAKISSEYRSSFLSPPTITLGKDFTTL